MGAVPAWAVAGYLAGAFEILLLLVAAALTAAGLGVSWRYFGYGALVFFVFQIATRVPIIQLLHVTAAPQIASSPLAHWGWLTFLAVTAALFEELGRYAGYRVLWRHDPKTWDRAVMYGLGHGGLESIVLVGAGTILTVYRLSGLANGGLAALPEPQQAAASGQLAAVVAQPV
jgi:uncharacterized membrane protein YhfC